MVGTNTNTHLCIYGWSWLEKPWSYDYYIRVDLAHYSNNSYNMLKLKLSIFLYHHYCHHLFQVCLGQMEFNEVNFLWSDAFPVANPNLSPSKVMFPALWLDMFSRRLATNNTTCTTMTFVYSHYIMPRQGYIHTRLWRFPFAKSDHKALVGLGLQKKTLAWGATQWDWNQNCVVEQWTI